MTEIEEKRLKALARAIVEGGKKTWRTRAKRVCKKMMKEPPSRLATGKIETWEDWHETLKRPDPEYSEHEFFNLLRSKPDAFLQELLAMDRESAHDAEKRMHEGYMSARLTEYIIELRKEKKD